MLGARITDGDRITLRTVEQEDVPFLQRGTANPELRYSLGSRLMNQIQVEEEEEVSVGAKCRFFAYIESA